MVQVMLAERERDGSVSNRKRGNAGRLRDRPGKKHSWKKGDVERRIWPMKKSRLGCRWKHFRL